MKERDTDRGKEAKRNDDDEEREVYGAVSTLEVLLRLHSTFLPDPR